MGAPARQAVTGWALASMRATIAFGIVVGGTLAIGFGVPQWRSGVAASQVLTDGAVNATVGAAAVWLWLFGFRWWNRRHVVDVEEK